MITLERQQLIKVMITQLDVYQIILISKNIINQLQIDLSKQHKFDTDTKAINQINFTGNITRAEGATMFFINDEVKETVLDFSKGIVKALQF